MSNLPKRPRVVSEHPASSFSGEPSSKRQKTRDLPTSSGASARLSSAPTREMIAGSSARRSQGSNHTRGAARGGKKLVIRTRKERPALPPDFEQVTWRKLEEACRAVLEEHSVRYSREELYSAVEDMCGHGMSRRLYDRLHELVAGHIRRQVASLHSRALEPAALLERVHEFWNRHCRDLVTLRAIFLVLDRTFAVPTSGVEPLWEAGMRTLKQALEERESLLRAVVDACLDMLQRERRGETIDRTFVSTASRLLDHLGLYSRVMEPPLLDMSDRFFHNEQIRLMDLCDVSGYLCEVERCIADESDRISCCFHATTSVRSVLRQIEGRMLQDAAASLLERGLEALLDAHRTDDLKRMRKLFQRPGVREVEASIPAKERSAECDDTNRLSVVDRPVAIMARWFGSYIERNVRDTVHDPERESEMVPRLLEFQDKMDAVVDQAFDGDEAFSRQEKDAIEEALNSRENKPAELVAKYMDRHLRAGSKASSEQETLGAMDRVLRIFQKLQTKDIFEEHYKKDLAKRLLLGRSASDDLEKTMLSRLKMDCGPQFTAKMEGMFRDMSVAKELMQEFRKQHSPSEWGGFDLEVATLTMNHWPETLSQRVVVPRELRAAQEIFTEFYLQKHSESRKLEWSPTWGRLTLRARFPSQTKELMVSEFQAMVLFLFNDSDRLSLPEIRDRTGIEQEELERTLLSLACTRIRVLGKEPKKPPLAETDEFFFNADFKSKLIRLRLGTVQAKESAKETKEVEERVQQNRQHQIDAAIVRVMKARRSLQHHSLMTEVMRALPFGPKVADVKKRIESLIERDYLERNEDNPQLYDYLA